MDLPEMFKQRMQEMLGKEYEDFLYAYEKPLVKGIRRNTLKCNMDTLENSLPFSIIRSEFSVDLFYAPKVEKLGNLAAHHAGMFYVQEPSASSAVTILDPKPGDRVLDLCAAPGGKTTQIAAALRGNGLIWANEIIKDRANVLLSNVERMGIQNAVVTSLHPEKLCNLLSGFFDKVLVDAPCSGEGMFKKEPQAITAWSEESVHACAVRQRSILNSAAKAVRNNGVLVYSTCTFSKEENEDTVLRFLEEHPEFELMEIAVPFGRKAFGIPALRILPMDGGEGHFVAMLRRVSDAPRSNRQLFSKKKKTQPEINAESLYADLFDNVLEKQMLEVNEKIYILPQQLPELTRISVMRAGVLLGEIKGRRIEPSHHLFMSQPFSVCRSKIDFHTDDAVLYDFLHGEEIDCEAKGYTAVSVNGVITGFGKASSGRLKNRYPKGLRILK